MRLMLEHDEPDDFVIATGETHTIKELVEYAFECIDITNWSHHVTIDADLFRPAEVDYLCGDSNKAQTILGWVPEYSFYSLIEDMIRNEI